jgi:hypothetical protein
MSFKELCKNLESKIKNSYEQGVTIPDAELLAAEFLAAQIKVSEELKVADLDARMRKSGVKAVRAAIYMEAATKDQKKPSDVLLAAMVDMNQVVQSEQDDLDKAEVERDDLERYYSIFQQAHIYFRGIAKGNFGG